MSQKENDMMKKQDKTFDELVEEATIKIHSALLEGGGKAMKSEIYTQLANTCSWAIKIKKL
jgi:hypothetical protein